MQGHLPNEENCQSSVRQSKAKKVDSLMDTLGSKTVTNILLDGQTTDIGRFC